MNLRHYSAIALSVLLVGLLTFALIDSRSSEGKRGKTSEFEVAKQEAYVRALEERLDALENKSREDRLFRLEERKTERNAEQDAEVERPNKEVDAPSAPGAAADKVDFRAVYDTLISSEGTDPAWSSNREVEITAALQGLNLPGLSLTKVTCARTLCELNLSRSPEFQAENMGTVLSRIHPAGSFYTDTDQKTGQLIVFVSREGELPAFGPQDG